MRVGILANLSVSSKSVYVYVTLNPAVNLFYASPLRGCSVFFVKCASTMSLGLCFQSQGDGRVPQQLTPLTFFTSQPGRRKTHLCWLKSVTRPVAHGTDAVLSPPPMAASAK